MIANSLLKIIFYSLACTFFPEIYSHYKKDKNLQCHCSHKNSFYSIHKKFTFILSHKNFQCDKNFHCQQIYVPSKQSTNS